ncbi:hypothetical protein ABUW04_12425 [Streptacidiphilus sp. N1-10]|uniref:Uncharacterized protein n=1 Tax=Streptacidiphilus jeojiensis TaxID=3229225 RepID=A0ABV6XLB8_9ACTN
MSSVQWGDVPTWITAVATLAAAGGAFFAAVTAFRQLREQRSEIARQGAEQARLALLQNKQLEQLNQQASALRRTQAEQACVSFGPVFTSFNTMEPSPGGFAAVTVDNQSGRPFRNVRSRLVIDGAHYPSNLVYPGTASPNETVDTAPGREYEPFLVRGGDTRQIIWSKLYNRGQRFLLRFQDDAGIEWQVDHDLHLAEAPDADW